MTSLKIPPACIRLAAHEYQIPLPAISRQIYDSLRALGRSLSGSPWTCFPFCTHDHPPDQHRSWPRMGDFRDGLVAGLLQTPPSDDSECADIKRILADDLESQRHMFSEDGMHLTGDFLAVANSLVDERERDLTVSPGHPLTLDDMRFYACMAIQARIRQILDADIASGQLVVSVVDGKPVIALDALVFWGVPRKITVEQPALPGCEHSFVDDSHQRLRQRISAEAMAAALSDGAQVTSADARQNRAALDITLERGARRRILEKWDNVELLHGQGADAHQVLRVLKSDKGEVQPTLKTVQNLLITLRKEKLIP